MMSVTEGGRGLIFLFVFLSQNLEKMGETLSDHFDSLIFRFLCAGCSGEMYE
jgi:hypothetical protein